MAISLPHAGTSYNPTDESHQALLQSTLTTTEAEEAAQLPLQAIKARWDAARTAIAGRETWELAEMDVDRSPADGDQTTAAGADSTAVADSTGCGPSKRSKLKTKKQRRRIALNRRAEVWQSQHIAGLLYL